MESQVQWILACLERLESTETAQRNEAEKQLTTAPDQEGLYRAFISIITSPGEDQGQRRAAIFFKNHFLTLVLKNRE